MKNETSKTKQPCTLHSVIASYSIEQKEDKALSWWGVLTNRQKSKYAKKYYNKLSIEIKTSEKIVIWENNAWGNWL
jgi:hypothetical protein